MPHPTGRKIADKIFIELIEADVEIGFALVDEAKAYRASGQQEFSARALQNAKDILADIESRLRQLGTPILVPFFPLSPNCVKKSASRRATLPHPASDLFD